MNMLRMNVVFNMPLLKLTFLGAISMCILYKANANDILDEIILKDMIPLIGTKCATNQMSSSSGITNYTFEHYTSPSYWDPTALPTEPKIFLAEMSNTNLNNSNRSWSIRVSTAGNIYSLRGAYGEAMPPQFHLDGEWVDEVIQSVSVNLQLNGVANYFMHQSGAYTKDGAYTEGNPFFSPNIAKYCGDKECLFGTWGTQAHLPTAFKSNILYFNGYRDCGNGVIEHTSVFHNLDVPGGPYVNYLNVPWGGVRTSVLRDLHLSSTDGTLDPLFRMNQWGDNGLYSHKDTGGFTTYGEQIEMSQEKADEHEYNLPDGVSLVIAKNNAAQYKSGHSANHQPLYCMSVEVEPTVVTPGGCHKKCFLWLTNARTLEKIVSPLVLHWAWSGIHLFFCTYGDVTVADFNEMFTKGDEILISHSNYGKPYEDNMALTYVHGQDSGWHPKKFNNGRIRTGNGGMPRRDYSVYTTNSFVRIDPGDTYVFQQYLITGELSAMEELGTEWKDEIYKDLHEQGEMDSHDINLYSRDNTEFGVEIVSQTACSQGQLKCMGKSTPQLGSLPLFAITCGTRHYVGSDLYHFSPPRSSSNDPIRSYACDGEEINVRPEWKLLGFFPENSCSDLQSAAYSSDFCKTPTLPPTEQCPGGKWFDIEIKIDKRKNGDENKFALKRNIYNGSSLLRALTLMEGDLKRDRLYKFGRCLDTSFCYEFTLKDKRKDGICCNRGEGYISLEFNGQTYNNDFRKGKKRVFNFGDGCPSSQNKRELGHFHDIVDGNSKSGNIGSYENDAVTDKEQNRLYLIFEIFLKKHT